jgi:hypothetical protein
LAIKDAIQLLKSKPMLGEYGAVTRPFVILDVDEYRMLLDELEKLNRRKRVPREAERQTA